MHCSQQVFEAVTVVFTRANDYGVSRIQIWKLNSLLRAMRGCAELLYNKTFTRSTAERCFILLGNYFFYTFLGNSLSLITLQQFFIRFLSIILSTDEASWSEFDHIILLSP